MHVLPSAGSEFFSTDTFLGTYLDFRFMMFTQVLMKDLYISRSLSVKYLIVGCLSKCCCQCTSYLLARTCIFEKDAITVKVVALIQVSFLTVIFKQKSENATWNDRTSLYHSKVRSTQDKGFDFYLVCVCKVKVFYDNLT